MPKRDHPPVGSPCWADLWTSDVAGSRSFYADLFGWTAEEANPEFGGYFMFTKDGVPMAGAMGDMGDMKATDTWTVYLATDDANALVTKIETAGGQVNAPPMAVADLGTQIGLSDSTGAKLGAWQPGTFPGFTILSEPGTPSWFELHTPKFGDALAFYGSAFDWTTDLVSDTDAFRYATLRVSNGEGELAGVVDENVDAYWTIYWHVDDVAETVKKTEALGGSIIMGASDSPYGALATLNDPFGAQFRLRTPPK